ncbi:MAG: S-layer homology domain-containing protein [Acidimicrobiia bacterium]|nr:S-layer homology domain-containing protein [Acidimicrobiia bacterium]
MHIRIALLALALLAQSVSPLTGASAGVATPGGTFVDDDGNTHEGMIEEIAALAITVGCDVGRYCPALAVSRGQMASFLARAFGLPAATDDYFADDNGSTHEDNINRIYEAGVSTGFVDGTYRPGEPVNRAQMASFLARALGLAPVATGPFVDVSGVHAGNINAIYVEGITVGCSRGATYYCPGDPVRRDQMASLLGRSLELTPAVVPPRDWNIAVSALDAADIPIGIHVVDGNTGAATVLTADVDAGPEWNAVKARIAFHRLFEGLFTDPNAGEDFVPPARVVEADGSTEYDVDSWLQAAGEMLGSFDYSFGPDGRLAVDAGNSFPGTDRDLWIADIDGASVTELASDASWWLTDPKWSHGGDYIAVYAGDGLGGESTRIFDAVTGMQVVDIPEPASFTSFIWSPASETILIHLSDDVMPAGNELLWWDVALADGTPITLPGAAFVTDFDWSPDGSKVAYASDADGDFDIHLVDLGTEDVSVITTTAGDEREPVWSPDGAMLAFEADGGVRIVVAETGVEVGFIPDAADPDW